jgi:hypothetical protein
MRRRGMSEIPALEAETPLTDWKRCGILTTREVKGKPAKKAFLSLLVRNNKREHKVNSQ